LGATHKEIRWSPRISWHRMWMSSLVRMTTKDLLYIWLVTSSKKDIRK